jgi:hypothetical protein
LETGRVALSSKAPTLGALEVALADVHDSFGRQRF